MLRYVAQYLSQFEKLSKHNNFVFRDSFPINYVEEILIKHHKTFDDLPKTTRISIKRDNVEMPLKINMTNDLLEVIGLYVAEGHLRKNNSNKGFYQLGIAGNSQVKNFVRKTMMESFGLNGCYENKDQVIFSSRILYELFKNYLCVGDKAHGKRIPTLILNMKKNKLAAFLRGYFE